MLDTVVPSIAVITLPFAKGDKVSLTIQIPQSNGEYEEKTVEVTLGAK